MSKNPEKTVISNEISKTTMAAFRRNTKARGHKQGWVLEKLIQHYNKSGLPVKIEHIND